jgi:serine protease Do
MQLASGFEPADAHKLGLDRLRGALIERVYQETPAASAGLQVNDVILQVDDVAIRNENHLINHISSLPVGRRVRLQVWRDRAPVTLEATVGDWARAQNRFRAEP